MNQDIIYADQIRTVEIVEALRCTLHLYLNSLNFGEQEAKSCPSIRIFMFMLFCPPIKATAWSIIIIKEFIHIY